MSNTPLVSVIMPVYNTDELFLREAIESILKQTFKDFEFIIIDDKSTNNAPQIIAEYAEKDGRIRIVQGLHHGLSDALNRGLNEAKGKYVARMDSDDISLPNRLEKQVSYMEKHNEISILGCFYETIPNKKLIELPLIIKPSDLLKKCPVCHPTAMMKMSDIIKYDLYYHNVPSEDYDLWARAIRFVNIVNLPDVLLNYRVLENSFSHTKRALMYSNETSIKEQLINWITDDKKLQKKIRDHIYLNKMKSSQKIFSIRSRYVNGKKQKVVIVFGKCFYKAFPSEAKHIVKIMGGLGNQMFQYAFGQNFNDVVYDISVYGKREKRTLDLELYNIKKTYASEEQTKPYLKKSKFPRFIRKWFNIPKYKNVTKEERINKYNPYFLLIKDTYFEGYFQTDKYFRNNREKILHDLTLKKPLDEANAKLLEEIKRTNSVSIHIRRGDYLTCGYPILGIENYYQKAIDYIAKRVKNPHFYIFSNDFDWVKENLKSGYEQTIVDINDEGHGYFDLELMRHCKHNIIANSSFSWWGAWLNENPDKIVIAPTQWFKPDAKECFDDMIPDEWIKL